MKWTGKIVGLLIGLLSRRLPLLLLAVTIGHLYDIGMFSGGKSGTAAPPPTPPVPDPYAVLGIEAAATDEQVEQAYRRAMSEYHPDRVATAAAEIQELAGRRAREINGAYETIKRQRGL